MRKWWFDDQQADNEEHRRFANCGGVYCFFNRFSLNPHRRGTSLMSVQYVMDAQNGVVCSTFTGLLTSDDLRDHAVNLGKDPKFKSTFRELADLTTATDVNLGSMFVASSVSFDPFSQKSKRAFVVPPQGPVLAWTRMMGSLRENPNIQVFTSMEEARKWLGMP